MKSSQDLLSRLDYSNIASYKVTDTDCEALVLAARTYGITTIVISPASVKICLDHIVDTIKIAVSIAYPSGALSIESKTEEIDEILKIYPRIDEFFVVVNMGLLLADNFAYVDEELKAIMKTACGKTVKLAVETGIMPQDYMQKLCDMAVKNNIPYIVASTGFVPYDTKMPTIEQTKMLVDCARDRIKIVACGDITTLEQAQQYLSAGADRVCIEQGVRINANAQLKLVNPGFTGKTVH
jgi:deoxyribose-phosphate aldolase